METKNVRRVRTRRGSRRFGQPIGTVIVRDIVPDIPSSHVGRSLDEIAADIEADPERARNYQPTGVLKKVDTDYPGWDKFVDGPNTRYVGKDDGEWIATDENDYAVTEGYTRKTDAISAMHDQYLEEVPDNGIVQFPRKTARGKYAKAPAAALVERDRLRHVKDERELLAMMRKYKFSVPAEARNVYISDDPDNPDVQTYAWFVQKGGKSDGKPQSRQKPEVAAKNAETKFDRVDRFAQDVHKIDAAITSASVAKDDALAAIAFMRRLGARVGTSKVEGNEERGITDLRREDVTIEGNVVYIEYRGKKGSTQYYEFDDPILLRALKIRLAKMNKAPTTRFFPGLTSKMTIDKTRSIIGGDVDYGNHDFRRLFATEQAAALVKATRPAPRTQAEFNEKVKYIGSVVDEMLNDKNQALKSYVDPRVFSAWRKRVEKGGK